MQKPKKLVTHLVIAALLLVHVTPCAYAESVDERFTQISPKHNPGVGSGEFVHGTSYGKILSRVMIFGSVPQQGIHYVPEGTDLLFAILYAGGYGDMTKLDGITIRRRGVTELIQVDLEELIEGGKNIPKLVDGDVVNVPFSWRKDYQQFVFFSSILTSLTGLVLAVVALTRTSN